jgi:hypothetical protein
MQRTAKTASPLTMDNISSPSDIRDLTRPAPPRGRVGLFRGADSGENGVVPARICTFTQCFDPAALMTSA